MELSGPVAGAAQARTKFSPTGRQTRGTQNNCGTGSKPWGTFITSQENWAGYFARDNNDNTLRSAKELVSLARYGLGQNTTGRYGWATAGSDDRYALLNASVLGTAADGSGQQLKIALDHSSNLYRLQPYRHGGFVP